jgi:hypothetical protein
MAVKQRPCPIERRRAALRPILSAEPVRSEEARPARIPPLRPVSSEVVAEILADGSIREVGERTRPPSADYETGQISGDDWILWWERRRLGD